MKKVKLTDIVNKKDFSTERNHGNKDDLLVVNVADIARISILKREICLNKIDIESGVKLNLSKYIETEHISGKDKDEFEFGDFWVVSGMFDITSFDSISYEEVILEIVKMANSCKGKLKKGFCLKTYLEELSLKELEPISQIRRLAGYVENSSEAVVTIFQDDATKNWHIKAGAYHKYSDHFMGLFK